VSDRLRTAAGPVAIMLSGGLDSGSVAALAAPILAARGERLLAYTSVPRFAPAGADARRMGDEGPPAQALAAHIGNIDWVPVAAEHAGVLAAIERLLAIHGQPQHGPANYYWMLEILAQARQRCARVLLTGQGGNATVSWTGTGNLWPDLRAGQWATVLASLRAHPAGVWPALRQRLLRPALVPALTTRPRRRDLKSPPWAAYSAIHPAWAESLRLAERMRAAGHDPTFTPCPWPRHPRNAGFRLGLNRSAVLGSLWMELSAAHGLSVCDPTRDRRVIEFCWQVPDRVHWADGRRRGLIREGFAGLLPATIRYPVARGLQAADLGHRLQSERTAIEATLTRLAAHPLAARWLDVPKMQAVHRTVQEAVTPITTGSTASVLLRGLCVGLFLTKF
jgi:asparagine synthase (glutamine-hydrolysing)